MVIDSTEEICLRSSLDSIIKSLSELLSINRNVINLKGKTVEKLGIIGKEQAIACEVICSLSKWKK